MDVVEVQPVARKFIVTPAPDRERSWFHTAVKDVVEAIQDVYDDLFDTSRSAGHQREHLEDLLQPLTADPADLEPFCFPPGHPRPATLYAKHPVVDSIYYPFGTFHRFAFEHKFNELVRILRFLGATEIEVEHVIGYDEEFAGHLDVALGSLEAARSRHSRSRLLYRAEYTGRGEPSLPPGLVWFPHELTWIEQAEARMDGDLNTFSVNLAYEESYAVEGSVAAKVAAIGLGLGGEFQQFEKTTWSFSGKFKPN